MTVTLTSYQSQYFAWLLSRRIGVDSADMLASTLVDAQVDLNPHQVEAALFAFQSPLSKGVILADEVGLGKTIEAGLVIAQRWAERKRHILIITPANLRKQWHQELQDKFSLQALILEAKSYKERRKENSNPFDQANRLLICSYQFAKAKADDLRRVPWDLVVMDEAHRLRNVYKPSNVIGKALKDALANAPKVLLTATPLQNSLLELYGLVSLVDERVFGDLPSFRDQFGALNNPDTVAKLRARLHSVCMRTLRRQVQPYISYTRRIPMVEQFTPSQDEQVLREMVAVRRTTTVAATLDEKLHWQKRQRELEDKRNQLRRRIFDRQDEIDGKRSQLIDDPEVRLSSTSELKAVFTIQWDLQ